MHEVKEGFGLLYENEHGQHRFVSYVARPA